MMLSKILPRLYLKHLQEKSTGVSIIAAEDLNFNDLICCMTGLNEGGTMRNIALQLFLQQCCFSKGG